MNIFRKIVFTALLFASTLSMFSQTSVHSMSDGEKRIYYTSMAEAESKILAYYKERKAANSDTFCDENFPHKMFADLVIHDKRAMRYPYSKILSCEGARLRIIDSDDKKMRLYSWRVNGCGTASIMEGVTSVLNNNHYSAYVHLFYLDGTPDIPDSKEFPPVAPGALSIKRITDEKHEDIYLVKSFSKGSSRIFFEAIEAYKLDDTKIIPANVFSGDYHLSVSYDCANSDFYGPAININQDTIEIIETRPYDIDPFSDDVLTDRSKKYVWNGIEYIYSGFKYHNNLHKGLCNYLYNIIVCEFDKRYIIRIDKMPNGEFRYTSWDAKNSGLDISKKPSIVLFNGTEKIIKKSESEINNTFEYTFTNKEYSYSLSWHTYHTNKINFKLIVKKNNLTLMELTKKNI